MEENKKPVNSIPQITPTDPEPEIKPVFQNEPESIVIPKLETNPAVPVKLPEVPQKPKKKIWLIAGIALTVALIMIIIPSLLVVGKAKGLYNQTKALAYLAKTQTQNFPALKAEIGKTKTSLISFRNTFKLAGWMKIIPFLGSYVKDVDHGTKAYGYSLEAAEITISVIEPYANVLGFSAETAKDGGKTAQDRIDFIAKAIPTILPKLDEIMDKTNKAKTEIENINPERYPLKLGKNEIREPMKNALALFDEAAGFIAKSKPLLEATPYLLGLETPRTYLILFQNDKELRPTGGFMTAYAIMKVDKAKFSPVSSNDIYNLDAQYKPRIKAPDPLAKYIKGPYILSKNIRLRDLNWQVDFADSMAQFNTEIATVGIKNIDGIIAVDTGLLVNLLDAIGPIGVSGFGNFSTKIEPKCNCPQVIYELESFADVEGPIIWDPLTGKIILRPANSDNRKKIIGPLMNSILANAMGQPKDKLPLLFAAAFKSLTEKHVLFYLKDATAQKGVESFGIAGKVEAYDGDYLMINDANLGGRKSNLYVTQEVEQTIETKGNMIEKTITITYKNPEKFDGWLNSVLPDWIRIYVPKGSQLLATEGLEDKAEPYEEYGKTVFAGFYQLRPEGVAKITVKYTFPAPSVKGYKLLIQKQPGTDAPLYTVKYGKKTEEFYLRADKLLRY